MYDVEKTPVDILSDQDSVMLALRPPTFLIVPILDSADDMSLIRFSKHYFNLVHRVILWVLKQNIQASARRLAPLSMDGFKFPKTEAGRVVVNLILEPELVKPRVSNRDLGR